jgi:hypothetical protein
MPLQLRNFPGNREGLSNILVVSTHNRNGASVDTKASRASLSGGSGGSSNSPILVASSSSVDGVTERQRTAQSSPLPNNSGFLDGHHSGRNGGGSGGLDSYRRLVEELEVEAVDLWPQNL